MRNSLFQTWHSARTRKPFTSRPSIRSTGHPTAARYIPYRITDVTGAVTVTRDPYQGTLRRCGYRNLYAQTTISKWVRLDLRRLD